MTPICEITIDGVPVSGRFMSRLRSCTVTDEEGITADRVEFLLDDEPPAAIPREGARIGVRMGYIETGLADMGEFFAQDYDAGILPYEFRITGKAADLGGKTKDQKERHFDDTTLGDIVRTIASENDHAALIAPSLAAVPYEWIGQMGESDTAFLERLAQRHDALFAIKAGTVIFAARGAGETPDGRPLTPYVIAPSIILPGTTRYRLTERTKFKAVVAAFMDRRAGERREVKVPCDPEGEGTHTMDQPFASREEAESAAKAKAKELRRRQKLVLGSIVGDVRMRAGAPFRYQGVRTDLDGAVFIASTVTHAFDARSGYTTDYAGELKV